MKQKHTKFYEYDVAIIGAGHAGCEAALASARFGAKTVLVTISLDNIGLMSCNSAIGGPGRGQLVREVDALSGEIAKNADKNFLHSRIMNLSKGPALRTLRVIVDKKRYFLSMKNILEKQDNLDLRQGLVIEIIAENKKYKLKTSDGSCYFCKSIVIATGTFLRANIFWGNHELNAGRQGEINSVKLAYSLEKAGYKFGRLRTETPPRVDMRTINFDVLKIQAYDKKPEMFSYENEYDRREQINNYITYVEDDCIKYISKNIKKSPIFKKNIISENPKYCPSIEDKIKNFKGRQRHLVFIQPEGRETSEMYLHGLFTTFPEEIQQGIINRIKGLEKAVITRPGYGVEYDYLLPYQIDRNLESKKNISIFFAGQINGSTGYEEAAAQGIIAGYNAALRSKGRKTINIEREDGYIGILLDDIAIKGVTEPYRMLTSRNEHRLYHRHDNADLRMIKLLKLLGQKDKSEKIKNKYIKIEYAFNNIKNTKVYKNKNILEDIKQNRADNEIINDIKKDFLLDDRELESLIINIKYETYIQREKERIAKAGTFLKLNIPADIDYSKIKYLSSEGTLALKHSKPQTVNQASRLEGVRPTDILTLVAYIKNVSRET